MTKPLEPNAVVISGVPVSTDVIYDNLFPYVIENGAGRAFSQTCKGLYDLMTFFLQDNTEKIREGLKNNTSKLGYGILAFVIPTPLAPAAEHYKLNNTIVQCAKRSGLIYPTQRVLNLKEIEGLGQAIDEDQDLEAFWPHFIAQIEGTHPQQPALDPKIKACGIRTWMRNNTELLEKIKTLEITQTPLKRLPSEIGYLKNLHSLNLWGNQLTSISHAIGNLKQLKNLYLGSNQLTTLPDEIEQLKDLSLLDLSGNQFTTCPGKIFQLTNMRNLSLSSNPLAMLPPEIGNLTNLSMLSLSYTKITALPDAIGKLTDLRELNISNCELSTLPTTLGALRDLRKLYIRNNQLTWLPREIAGCTELNCLDLGKNQLTELPIEISQCANLKILGLDGNHPLIWLPHAIQQIPNLKIYR